VKVKEYHSKVKGKAVPQHTYGGEGGKRMYCSYSFTTLALDGVSGQRHAPAALHPQGKDPHTHCTGGWVGPRSGLDTEEKCLASARDRTSIARSSSP
jgi:hypothetical protein